MSKLIMTINVTTYEVQCLDGPDSRVVMIPFSAEAQGEFVYERTVTHTEPQARSSDASEYISVYSFRTIYA